MFTSGAKFVVTEAHEFENSNLLLPASLSNLYMCACVCVCVGKSRMGRGRTRIHYFVTHKMKVLTSNDWIEFIGKNALDWVEQERR